MTVKDLPNDVQLWEANVDKVAISEQTGIDCTHYDFIWTKDDEEGDPLVVWGMNTTCRDELNEKSFNGFDEVEMIF